MARNDVLPPGTASMKSQIVAKCEEALDNRLVYDTTGHPNDLKAFQTLKNQAIRLWLRYDWDEPFPLYGKLWSQYDPAPRNGVDVGIDNE